MINHFKSTVFGLQLYDVRLLLIEHVQHTYDIINAKCRYGRNHDSSYRKYFRNMYTNTIETDTSSDISESILIF